MKIPNKRELQQIASSNSSDIDFKDFMKLYKDYTKEPYSFLVNDIILSSDNPLRIRKNLLKMTISDKMKTIDNKIEQNKAQFDWQRCFIRKKLYQKNLQQSKDLNILH